MRITVNGYMRRSGDWTDDMAVLGWRSRVQPAACLSDGRGGMEDMEEFVCLASCAGTYSGEKENMRADADCRGRLSQVENAVREDLQILVFTETEFDCRGNVADVAEHYDLATINPARIFVRKHLADTLGTIDFSALCRLFLKEKQFAVCELYPGKEEKRGYPYKKRRAGSYGTLPGQYEELFSELEAECGEVLPFFQNMVFQDMLPLFFSLNEKDASVLQRILERIDDDILCGTGCVEEDVLLKIFSLKYGEDIETKFVYRGGKLKYHNLPVVPLKELPFLITDISNIKGNFNICGTVILPLENSEIEYYFMDNKNKRYELEWEEGEEVFFLGEKLTTRKRFRAVFPVGHKPAGLRFMYRYQNMYQARVRMEFAETVGIVPDTRANFCVADGFLLKAEKRILFFAPLQLKTRIKLFFTFPWKSIKMYIAKKDKR